MKNEIARPPSTSTSATQDCKWVAILLLVALTNLAEANPLDTWTVRNGPPADNPSLTNTSLSSIAYGNGRFVAWPRVGRSTAPCQSREPLDPLAARP
jgi:hypothetical protein